MNLATLCDPLPGESPAGKDCEPQIQSQNLALMTEYLVERSLQKGRERAAEQPDLEEGEARNTAALRDDGKRRLTSLEGILKDVLKSGNVNVDLVGKLLRDKSSALLASTGKDLRLMPYLGAASTLIDGLEGYAGCLKLAVALLQNFPEGLFPLPDEDDPTDVWQRINAVSDLLSGDGIQALLGPVVVVDARQSGRITLADLVGGLRDDIPVAEVSVSDLGMALSELGPERVEQVLGLLRAVDSSINSLAQAFDSGALSTPRLADTFRRAISRIEDFTRGGELPDEPLPMGETRGGKSSASAPAEGRAGALHTREDAQRQLRDLIRFIEVLEPSHPAPLLLKRADRLLGMSFFEIIKDMAPGALSDIERIVGAEPSE